MVMMFGRTFREPEWLKDLHVFSIIFWTVIRRMSNTKLRDSNKQCREYFWHFTIIKQRSFRKRHDETLMVQGFWVLSRFMNHCKMQWIKCRPESYGSNFNLVISTFRKSVSRHHQFSGIAVLLQVGSPCMCWGLKNHTSPIVTSPATSYSRLDLPSGYDEHNYGKSPFLMVEATIIHVYKWPCSVAILTSPEGKLWNPKKTTENHQKSSRSSTVSCTRRWRWILLTPSKAEETTWLEAQPRWQGRIHWQQKNMGFLWNSRLSISWKADMLWLYVTMVMIRIKRVSKMLEVIPSGNLTWLWTISNFNG